MVGQGNLDDGSNGSTSLGPDGNLVCFLVAVKQDLSIVNEVCNELRSEECIERKINDVQ